VLVERGRPLVSARSMEETTFQNVASVVEGERVIWEGVEERMVVTSRELRVSAASSRSCWVYDGGGGGGERCWRRMSLASIAAFVSEGERRLFWPVSLSSSAVSTIFMLLLSSVVVSVVSSGLDSMVARKGE